MFGLLSGTVGTNQFDRCRVTFASSARCDWSRPKPLIVSSFNRKWRYFEGVRTRELKVRAQTMSADSFEDFTKTRRGQPERNKVLSHTPEYTFTTHTDGMNLREAVRYGRPSRRRMIQCEDTVLDPVRYTTTKGPIEPNGTKPPTDPGKYQLLGLCTQDTNSARHH